jgi:hypothetical protein
VTRPVRPLAARHWLLRNPRRILPAIVVQALVTALVLTVVTPLSGFEATAETALRPLRSFTAVTPMRKSTFDAELTALLQGDPGLERHVPAKTIWMRTPAIVGEFYTMIIALDRAEQERFYAAVGNRVAEGRYPTAGTEEVVIHRDVARARKMSVGSTFGRLVDPEDPAPGAFKVVGIADGESRVGLADLAYAMRPDFVLSRIEAFEVVFAKEGRKAESDRYLNDAKDAEGRTAFKVWDEAFFRRRTERSLANLPVILNAVVGAITVVIALVVILLQPDLVPGARRRVRPAARRVPPPPPRRQRSSRAAWSPSSPGCSASRSASAASTSTTARSSSPRRSRSASSTPIPSRSRPSFPSSPPPRARSCSPCASPAWTRCP